MIVDLLCSVVIVACPNDCSGHGTCMTIGEYNYYLAEKRAKLSGKSVNESWIVYGSANGMNTVAWDHDVMTLCVCDSSWPVGYGAGETQLSEYFGPDCSKSKWSFTSEVHCLNID